MAKKKNLKEFLDSEIIYNEKKGKFKTLTPLLFCELWDIGYMAERGYVCSTFTEKVADICREYGYIVEKRDEISWRIRSNNGGAE